MPTPALIEAETDYPVLGDETDWLAVAQRIAGLYEPPETGRPSSALIDVYRLHKLFHSLADGNYIETAVRAAGFSPQTFYNWKQQAVDGNIAAIAFMDAVEKARAEAESGIVADVRKAARKEQFWAAGMTLLERTRPERFGRRPEESGPKVVVQVGGVSNDVKVLISHQPTETFAEAPFASDVSTVSLCKTELSGDVESDKRAYVNQKLLIDKDMPQG